MKINEYPDFVQLRSVHGAYQEIKKLDPNSTISKAYLNELVETQQIRSFKCGKKRIVNLADVEAYFMRASKR